MPRNIGYCRRKSQAISRPLWIWSRTQRDYRLVRFTPPWPPGEQDTKEIARGYPSISSSQKRIELSNCFLDFVVSAMGEEGTLRFNAKYVGVLRT